MSGPLHYLEAIVNRIIGRSWDGKVSYSGEFDCHAAYRARVVSQSSDLRTVDVITDNPIFSRLGRSNIPLRWGIPGVTAAVENGAYVSLCFDDGDLAKPYCSMCDPWSVTQTSQINIGGGDTLAASARIGDLVAVTITPAIVAQLIAPGASAAVTLPGMITTGSKIVSVA